MEQYLHISRAEDLSETRDRRLFRILEIIPGLLSWLTLVLAVWLSFVVPTAMAVFIIIFDVYWLTKAVFVALHMRATFKQMRENMKRDWLAELERAAVNTRELGNMAWRDLYHLVILPMAYEPLSVVRESFASLAKSHYPLDRLIVVLATEERAAEPARRTIQAIEQEFGDKFFKFLATSHPDGLLGEIRGKGSNESWAAAQAKKNIIDPLGIPYERVVVSVFDVDTVVPHGFFACLAWHYITAEKPLRSSFQPIPIFSNNIWEAPAFARVFAFSTTFWQMIQQARPERLVTFSSQSISFKALVDVGFWQKNVVSEDSRIFWQCFLRYDGDWRTVPLVYPVYMDANVAPTFWQTVKNQYKQIRRWAWGVENNPYFLFGFLKNNKISRWKKWYMGSFMVESTHSLATNSIIIFLLGWLPALAGSGRFGGTILLYNLPQITRLIMNLAMVGLVSSVIISMLLLPPRPPQYGRFKALWMVLQWILLPINLIIFGCVPALDAQTRLALGGRWRLGFWVTPKSRDTRLADVSKTE